MKNSPQRWTQGLFSQNQSIFFFSIFKKGQGWAGEDCICQSSECLKMAQCDLMSLNMPEHGLLLLNVTKYA